MKVHAYLNFPGNAAEAFEYYRSISVHPDTREEADRIFNGLSAGGEVEMPIRSGATTAPAAC